MFRYIQFIGRAVDDETGVEIYSAGPGEPNVTQFEFFDPASTIETSYGLGKYRFYATILSKIEVVDRGQGRRVNIVRSVGYNIEEKSIIQAFKKYIDGDVFKIQKLKTLIAEGLIVWLSSSSEVTGAEIIFI